MGVDVAIEAEDSPTSRSSSSNRRSRNSSNLSSTTRSIISNTQYTNNRSSSSSDMEAGVKHSSTGAHHHIIHIVVIWECVIHAEERDISAPNAGQLLHLPLTSQIFQMHTSCGELRITRRVRCDAAIEQASCASERYCGEPSSYSGSESDSLYARTNSTATVLLPTQFFRVRRDRTIRGT